VTQLSSKHPEAPPTASNGSAGDAEPTPNPPATESARAASRTADELAGYVTPALPSWLLSLIVHLSLVMLLALWYLPPLTEPPLALVARVDDEQLEQLEEEPLDMEIEPAELDADQPLDQLVASDTEPIVQAVDLASLDDLALEAPPTELLPLGVEIGLLDSMAGAIDFTAGGFEGRGAAGRARLVRRGGGTTQSELAVEQSLNWLARHQHRDGYWSFDHRDGECQGQCDQPGNLLTGVKGATGLALLPFLGAGHTPRQGKHERVVRRGIDALVAMIEPTPQGGSLFDGGEMYSHGIASMALCEAYAMTGDRSLRAPAQAALAFICNAQDPKGGGWRYHPRQPGDTSVMGWQIGALKSGYLAELEVPPLVPERAAYFLDSVQLDGGEAYAYTQKELKFRPATTAIGLLCRMYLGAERDHPVLQRGVERLAELGPLKNDAYFNYYATQVLFQYTSGKGEVWDKWNKAMREMLISTRATEGHPQGSWVPLEGDHGKAKGGRLYATALNCMTLEVYYRLLPIYQSKAFEEGFEE